MFLELNNTEIDLSCPKLEEDSITRYGPDEFELFLKFLYAYEDVLDHVSVPTLKVIIGLAHRFLVDSLLEKADDLLVAGVNIDIDNWFDLFSFASFYTLEKSVTACFNFLQCNSKSILWEDLWELSCSDFERFLRVSQCLTPREHYDFVMKYINPANLDEETAAARKRLLPSLIENSELPFQDGEASLLETLERYIVEETEDDAELKCSLYMILAKGWTRWHTKAKERLIKLTNQWEIEFNSRVVRGYSYSGYVQPPGSTTNWVKMVKEAME
ncbi:hypothetical protein K493DRAFT_344712 [Basidiobolus meristosporus CBS 931.73]|uniref:BTB domain-containing protein n=1 Tax=Basidiobolus meristosporus CBS 931.73 TaxID=1314790 RepID=A0A1Y1Z748_9FUNG|nr:hypothetical protein K493DRAFT_344712 [Basidiobolus meristosporus CBS 931.73]|eukprot:ORY06118.1 hypothetical protein K493DRAFT_344712 [Basidiobolus meristosporus CBS 931.73]